MNIDELEYLDIRVTDGTDRKIEVLSIYQDDSVPPITWVDIQIDGIAVGTDIPMDDFFDDMDKKTLVEDYGFVDVDPELSGGQEYE